jgi:mRNA interferase RelE/StbE
VSAKGPYTVQYDPKALKELSKLDKPAARRILKAIDSLRVSPRPGGARPLVGYPDLWRIRVGDYRVIYTVKDAELVVLALRVAHCSTVYAISDRRAAGSPFAES